VVLAPERTPGAADARTGSLCRARNSREGVTWGSTLGAHAHPPCLPGRGPDLRL